MNTENNTSISQRIKLFIEYKGLSVNNFSKMVGASNSYFNKLIKNNSSIGSNRIEKIIRTFPEINPTWLIIGKEDMILAPNMASNVASNPENRKQKHTPNNTPNTKKESNIEIIQYPNRTDHYLQEQKIPLYDMEVVAGVLPMISDLSSQEPVDHLYIPNAPPCDGAVFATGDSMCPLLKSGDILAFKIINDIKNNVFWGEMYILYIDVEGDFFRVVKYVQKGKDERHYLLVSQNKHHQDKEVRIDKIRAMAQVKLSIRMN